MGRKQLKKYVKIKKVGGGKFRTYFTVHHQSFCIAKTSSKKKAVWFGDMLMKAIHRLIEENQKGEV